LSLLRKTGATLALVAALAFPASCTPEQAPPKPPPLVLVGVDGLEWRLVLELAAAGRMPNLAALAREGTFARLSTFAPAISPPIWTSMATGVMPERHGIVGFVQPGVRDGNGRPMLFTNRERRAKAVWNIADEAGLSSCIVGYWMTFPVEEIRGVMVAQSGAPAGGTDEPKRKGELREAVAGQVHPASYEARAFGIARQARETAETRRRELFGDAGAWPPAMKRVAEHSAWSVTADTIYQAIALDLLRDRSRCDVAIVYLGLPDVLGHRFWRWTYPGDFTEPPDAGEVEHFGDVLSRAYEQVDRFIGEVRRAAGPESGIVIASDHGMGAFRPKDRVDVTQAAGELLRTGGHSAARDGLFVAIGDAFSRSARPLSVRIEDVPLAGSVVDLAPTLLAALSLARGADMDGRTMTPLLDAAFLRSHPPREVPTHTPDGWAASRRFAASADDPAAAERLEQLRGLGYLD
jgi:arylsulfatase A-like enzyme